jgi:pimeloyl-ACP methyl ester carboxylesterase
VELKKWINKHELQGLDLLAHSHGGSVAMEATRHEIRVGDLVLLSCPAHESKYLPDFTMVTKVWHVRVRFDLVVLLDGGGFKFHDPQITDVRLPLWFDHGASHDPGVWAAHRVAQTIGWQ